MAAGLTNAECQATLDVRFPVTGGTDHIAYSTNGTSEFAGFARTPIGATGWAGATSADPSIKANANALTSAAASTGGTVTHFRIMTALTGGTARTEWTLLTASRAVLTGDQITWAIGACAVTLT